VSAPRRQGGGGRRRLGVVVARAREGSRGEERGRDREETTRGHVQELEVELGVRLRNIALRLGFRNSKFTVI
jgi:hypothetical protein